MSPFETLESRRHFAFGTVNPSFGTNGVVIAPTIGGTDSGFVQSLTQADGKTLVGVGGGLARFTKGGALDTAFGTKGVVGFRGFSFRSEAVDSSGRIYVLAFAGSGSLVLRYTAGGVLDTSFATSGTALVEKSKSFRPNALAVQSDGKIVVAGVRVDADNGNITRLYRLAANGSVDTGFGSSGHAEFNLISTNLITPQTGDNVTDLRVLSSGKIEVLGSSFNYAAGGYDDDDNYQPETDGDSIVALARLNASGSLDSSFASGGISRKATFDNELETAGGGVIKSDGSAVVSESDNSQSVFVGFSASGGVAYRTYAPVITGAANAVDATALPDGRTAFVSSTGATWTLSSAGVVGNVVTPANNDAGTVAIVTTATDDLETALISSGSVRLTNFDAGKATDARPDDLPAAGAIDTVVDQFGTLHVAFFDSASKTLKYTSRNANGYWSGIRTVDATVGAGAQLSIAATTVSGKTGIAIAYYEAGDADLRVATSATGTKFSVQTVASKGGVGLSPSIQPTDSGYYAMTYASKSTGDLYYALLGSKGWSSQVVDTGGAGVSSELLFDPSSGRPAIAYSGAKNTVRYALRNTKGGFDVSTVATTTAGATFVNLALPYYISYYGPRISYYDQSTADLILVTYDRSAAANARWSKHTIASRGAVGAFNELISDGYDTTLYGYVRNTDTVYSYSYDQDTGAVTPTAAVAGGGSYLSVATDNNDTVVALAYLDTASGKVFVR